MREMVKGYRLASFICLVCLCATTVSAAPFESRLESKLAPKLESKISPIGAVIVAAADGGYEGDTSKVDFVDLDDVDFFMSEYREPTSEIWPETVFDCVGSIHAVLRFSSSHHDLRNSLYKVKWFTPDGNLELISKHPSYYESDSIAYRVASIVLKRPEGGGLFSLLDHSAGMERFIGDWVAEIWIGGRAVKSLPLRVEC
jgi:hypothetical protein